MADRACRLLILSACRRVRGSRGPGPTRKADQRRHLLQDCRQRSVHADALHGGQHRRADCLAGEEQAEGCRGLIVLLEDRCHDAGEVRVAEDLLRWRKLKVRGGVCCLQQWSIASPLPGGGRALPGRACHTD
jgi:hypothetical protein